MGQISPKISIVTVYYNREDYVEESIQSLLDQTLTDFELLVVDDGSTDGTRDRLTAFKDPRIRFLFKSNSGFTDSIAHALKMARGEYVAIHGSGDVSLPTRMEKQHALLSSRPDLGVVGCWVENVATNGTRQRRALVDDRRPFGELLQESCIFTHGEVMYRREAYEKVGGYRSFFKFSQDYDLWFRMSEHYGFAVIPEVLYLRFSPPDTIRTNPTKMLIQLQLSELARQSALQRRATGRDIVDEFGALAFTQMQQSRSFGDRLVGIGAHMVVHRRDPSGHLLIRIGMLHSPSLRNQVRKAVADLRDGRVYALVEPLLRARRLFRTRRQQRAEGRLSGSA